MKKIVLLAFVLILLSTAVAVRFVRPVVADGTIFIRADGSIDPPTANIISLDNVTYTFTDNIYDSIVVERDNIVVDGAGCTVQGIGNGTGIKLSGRSNVTIRNMEIKSFTTGIYLSESSNNIISGNNITTCTDEGIKFYQSSNNTISGNNIINNYDGIRFVGSSNNTISGNDITGNHWDGIMLGWSSNYNSLFGNNITNNLYDGVRLSSSSNNVICHNNFINNTSQIHTANSVNVWDDGYPLAGNYWSDYKDVDQYSGAFQNETGSDGIWDHPYVIDENNQDNYPIVPEFSSWTSMLLILIVLTVAIAIYKRRILKTPIH